MRERPRPSTVRAVSVYARNDPRPTFQPVEEPGEEPTLLNETGLCLLARLACVVALLGAMYAVVMAWLLWDDFRVAGVINGVVWGVLSLTMWLVGRMLARLGGKR